MGQIDLKAGDGFECGAYASVPADNVKGGIVVLQEIFGVNPHMRSVVDAYAAEGYAAIAPQIFDRVERNVELGYTDQDDFNKGLKIAFEDMAMPDTLMDIQAAVDAMTEYGKVGVVGYCFGGLLTWLSACTMNSVSAAVSYYGGGISGEASRAPLCPVMMHFGDKDAHIPLTDVDIIKSAQPDVDIFVYNADHGFNCDVRASYDEKSAVTAKARSLEFFATHLV